MIDSLRALNARVGLGILDLTPNRASIVRKLNGAGIPVVAWLLLPMEQGYWLNVNNALQAAARYHAFKRWTEEYGLLWAGIGLDIEPDIREVERFVTDRPRLLRTLIYRLFNNQRFRAAQAAYKALVNKMQLDGYQVDSYHIPLMVDERRTGSTLLQRVAGLVDVPSDREVLMPYTSFLRPYGPGILWSYAADAQSLGIGSTGGGVDVAGLSEVPPLDWEELARDLRLARYWSDEIHIFSLEGCIEGEFLARLIDFNWDGPVEIPYENARVIDRLRRGLRVILWVSARPYLILVGLVGFLWLLMRIRPKKRSDA
ncbi:MAG: hypothetical protein JSV37_09255 [Anaerolineaceae bacterium]|nr:MAG: hypothetical protein JSV37_09255 [Anaerolineaceae bacterium]